MYSWSDVLILPSLLHLILCHVLANCSSEKTPKIELAEAESSNVYTNVSVYENTQGMQMSELKSSLNGKIQHTFLCIMQHSINDFL